MGDASPRGETTEKSVFSTRVEFFAWANSLMTGVFSGESSLGFCFAGIAAILTLARARTRRLSALTATERNHGRPRHSGAQA